MSIFKSFRFGGSKPAGGAVANPAADQARLAEIAFQNISDGLMILDAKGMIKAVNPAAATMTGFPNPESAVGLDHSLVLKLEDSEGRIVAPENNPIAAAIRSNTALRSRDYLLVTNNSERQMAVEINFTPIGSVHDDNVVTFRDITRELEEENERTEFVSTASHEMRTPVASIEGYLGLALNPQTATIDDRARQYLNAAHTASQHLGQLFKDLLDTTKLDDGRLKPHPEPVEMTTLMRQIFDEYAPNVAVKGLRYTFGTAEDTTQGRKMDQLLYAFVDTSFVREVIDNLIGNAVKYTPEGGEIWVNLRGDGDKILINVTDSGIGIAPDDLAHIFQKFYRVDNSQTRQIGGTGLGLYLVKQRIEAMGGRVWAESSFGDGSTFYVSLPRISEDEYNRQRIAIENARNVQAFADQNGGVVQNGGAAVRAATGTTTETSYAMPATAAPQAPSGHVPVHSGQVSMSPTEAVAPQQPAQPAAEPQASAPQQPVQPVTGPQAPQQPATPPQQPVVQTPPSGV